MGAFRSRAHEPCLLAFAAFAACASPGPAFAANPRAVSIHYPFSFYEQRFNVEPVVARAAAGERMYFVGVPLNIKDGDGMIVRPVVLAY